MADSGDKAQSNSPCEKKRVMSSLCESLPLGSERYCSLSSNATVVDNSGMKSVTKSSAVLSEPLSSLDLEMYEPGQSGTDNCMMSNRLMGDISKQIKQGDEIVEWLKQKYPHKKQGKPKTYEEAVAIADAAVEWLSSLTQKTVSISSESKHASDAIVTSVSSLGASTHEFYGRGTIGDVERKSTSQQHEDVSKKYQLFITKAKVSERKSDYKEAAEHCQKALDYQIQWMGEGHVDVAHTMKMLGRSYVRAMNYAKGKEYLEKALAIYESSSAGADVSPEKLWKLHDYIADACREDKLKQQRLHHYEEAIRIITEYVPVPPERLAHLHHNAASIYLEDKRLEKARDHAQKEKEMMELMFVGDKVTNDQIKNRSMLGEIYAALGENEKARDELEACILYRDGRTDNSSILANSKDHNILANVYTELQEMTKAEYHRKKALQPMERILGHNMDTMKSQPYENLLVEAQGRLNKKSIPVESAQYLIARAQAFQKAERHKQSADAYEKAIAVIENGIESCNLDALNVGDEPVRVLAMCHNNVGNSYRQLLDYDKAEYHLSRAYELRIGAYGDMPSEESAKSMLNLAQTYLTKGGRVNQEKAIDVLKQSIQVCEQLGGVAIPDTRWLIVAAYTSLGIVYQQMKQHSPSIEYYEKARAIMEEDGTHMEELQALYNNLGNAYKAIENYSKAEELLTKAVDSAEDLLEFAVIGDPKADITRGRLASSCNNLGVLYQSRSKYELSLQYLNRCKQIREEMAAAGDYEALLEVPNVLHNIGNTYMKQRSYERALESYQQERQKRYDLGEKDLFVLDTQIAQVLSSLGRQDSADQLLASLENYNTSSDLSTIFTSN